MMEREMTSSFYLSLPLSLLTIQLVYTLPEKHAQTEISESSHSTPDKASPNT